MVSPNPVTICQGSNGIGTNTFTASEAGYSGNFTAVSADTTVATVTPTTGSGLFTVSNTATTQSGHGTTITVTDTLSHMAIETVQVPDCVELP
jgi:predicted ABC-type ATPase